MDENKNHINAHDNKKQGIQLSKKQTMLVFIVLMIIAVFAGHGINSLFGSETVKDVFEDDSKTFEMENMTFIRKTEDTPVQKGDVVIFQHSTAIDGYLIKKVIATGGEAVYIDDWGGIYVNNEKYQTDFGYLRKDVAFPITVPDGHLFVLGDKNEAVDSRDSFIGCISADKISGIEKK